MHIEHQVKRGALFCQFETGAQRSDATGKGRYDLLSPWTLRRLARHMEAGVTEGGYEPRNWERGIPVHRFFDSAIRHLYSWLAGDRSEDHLAAGLWNIHGLIHTLEMVHAGRLPADLTAGLPEGHPDRIVPEKERSDDARP